MDARSATPTRKATTTANVALLFVTLMVGAASSVAISDPLLESQPLWLCDEDPGGRRKIRGGMSDLVGRNEYCVLKRNRLPASTVTHGDSPRPKELTMLTNHRFDSRRTVAITVFVTVAAVLSFLPRSAKANGMQYQYLISQV